MHRLAIVVAGLFLPLFGLGSPLPTLPAGPRLPASPSGSAEATLEVSADRVEVDVKTGKATLVGHVRLRRKSDGLSIESPKVLVAFDPKTGKVVTADVHGPLQASMPPYSGTASSARLDMAGHVLELVGPLRLRQGDAVLAADSARIDLDTGALVMSAASAAGPAASFLK